MRTSPPSRLQLHLHLHTDTAGVSHGRSCLGQGLSDCCLITAQ